jgi:hypothetical protein
MSPNDSPSTPVEISLIAGTHPNGQLVVEKLQAVASQQPNQYWLLLSPLFVPGCARGDRIELLQNNPGRFRMRERSGQIALRVFVRDGVARLAEELTPAIELLGGRLDVESERALVYSIHVAVGFGEIEKVVDPLVVAAGGGWNYGNVFDPESGEPMNWWEEMLNP